jgi:hypothetical protein
MAGLAAIFTGGIGASDTLVPLREMLRVALLGTLQLQLGSGPTPLKAQNIGLICAVSGRLESPRLLEGLPPAVDRQVRGRSKEPGVMRGLRLGSSRPNRPGITSPTHTCILRATS